MSQKEDGKVSQATTLVNLATAEYTFHRDTAGDTFAVARSGPRIVRGLRGGNDSLRAELASRYYKEHDKAPSSTALADAMQVLIGQALDTDPIPLHLRVAEDSGALWLDIGDITGRAVRITAQGWAVTSAVPVYFKRTKLTAALPDPIGGGGFDDLWSAANVAPDRRPLVIAALVATLFPNIAHPIVLLRAGQGAGKTTAAKRLIEILDPSPASVRKPPEDPEAWVTAASGSHVVGIDNVSRISEWFSDALCRASTGDGDVRRRLYTDDDLVVFAFRRAVWLTAIDPVGIRPDLADRALDVQLEPLAGRRRPDTELDDAWERVHPAILGAVLDLAVEVLRTLPHIPTDDLPRMADFHRILLAVDHVMGTNGAETSLRLGDDLAQDLASSDPLIGAIQNDITEPWTGAAGELLAKLDSGRWDGDRHRPKEWPKNSRELTRLLRLHGPNMLKLGWSVADLGRGGKSHTTQWGVTPPAGQDWSQ